MRLPSPVLVLACLAVSLSAFAKGADPAAERVRALAQQAIADAASPRAAAALVAMDEFRDAVEDASIFWQTYGALAERRRTHPLVRSTAQLLLADIERARGRTVRAQELTSAMGFVQDFWVVGGFDNEGKGGCSVDPGVEANVDLTATYPVKGRDVHWQKLPVRSTSGYVDLGAALEPDKEVVAYALTNLEATQEGRAVLSLGTSGGYRLWVNGQLASSSDRYNQPRPDQARVSVRLARGPNRVLLKVCQDTGAFGFYLRAEPERGLLRASAPDALPAAPRLSPQPQPQPTLTDLLAADAAKHPKDAQRQAAHALVLSFFRAFEATEHTDAATAERAAELAPDDAWLQLLAARLQREDANLRRRHLERALAVDPSNAVARVELASFELEHDHADRALALARPLLEQAPAMASGHLMTAVAHDALDEYAQAVEVTERAVRALPQSPALVRHAARLARRMDRPEEALARLRVAAALRHDDEQSRRVMAQVLADLGRVDDAVRALQEVVALDPFSNADRLDLAELLAANGKLEAAEQAFTVAKQLAPDDATVHEREARALLSAGRKEEAVAAFDKALQLRPQNPALKEVLRTLRGETAATGAQHLIDARPLLARADQYAEDDLVYVVDNSYVRVQPSGLSSRLHQLVVKVRTERGVNQLRRFPITYSPDRQEVRVLRARITKPDGSIVDSYGDTDRNINEPWSGMYYDARAKELSFPALAAGDVLEIQYRLEDTAAENLLSDYWGDVEYVQSTAPKLRWQLLVDMPASRPLYWNRSKLDGQLQHAVEPQPDGRQLYRWSADAVAKLVPEPMMPGWAEVATTLHVSTYQTWEQVGRYYWGLVRDQLTPNEELRRTTEKVLAKVDRKDPQAVVHAVYNFVVSNTRYVALEFGIHGYKPYRVDRVLARRFGDCKDKASLIHAMLKVAGVDSRLVLLRMRHLGAIGEEPASLAAFNHAIVYVPGLDLYLDGTAEFHNARELPSSDRVANVLIVEPGAQSPFLTTPEAKAQQNAMDRQMAVTLRTDGGADVAGKTVVSGQNAPSYRRAFQSESTRKQLLEQQWAQSFPGLKVSQVTLGDLSRLDDDVALGFEMTIPRFSEVGTQTLRFHPFGTGRTFTQTFAPLTSRRYDLVTDSPWLEKLRYEFTLPEGYQASELPQPIKDETPFGHLYMECRMEAPKLVCQGELALEVARVKAADYPAYRAFLGRVDQAFGRKLVVSRQSGQTAAR